MIGFCLRADKVVRQSATLNVTVLELAIRRVGGDLMSSHTPPPDCHSVSGENHDIATLLSLHFLIIHSVSTIEILFLCRGKNIRLLVKTAR